MCHFQTLITHTLYYKKSQYFINTLIYIRYIYINTHLLPCSTHHAAHHTTHKGISSCATRFSRRLATSHDDSRRSRDCIATTCRETSLFVVIRRDSSQDRRKFLFFFFIFFLLI